MSHDPKEAVKDTNVVVTDTFISMGEEDQREAKLKLFEGYQVSEEMMAGADKDWIFMHCLPRHEEEVTDGVFYSDRSVVFQEAQNRMYTVMAVLLTQHGVEDC